ncbi:acetylornithine deacetylase/succinyl-diaminopimelate desuccinylase [Cenarchaeum symbiosum A]|uniref:Putative [LysW]-lysine/[LysW]-ornithine hydrolase n=1 Tax=Cenarchaeum symbiosum (strain A) TaxID=414004 RepID=A0RTV3_CENSY|nr:acetylornithine deacetylase/succinyl-diaminopimelate desuccinylase [Cenarchaeum symbiosum A]
MLEKALRLYTPSMAEKPMAEFLADKCDDLGFEDITIDDVGNIIATRGSGPPHVMLCGHMDVVPGKVRVRRDGDRLYGRGASDAKAPLMAMLFAAAAMPHDGGTVKFVGAVDEEGNATGIKHLVKQDLDVDYAVFGEPSGLRQVTIAYKGRLAINLRISAEDSSHASAPWLSKNAIEEAMLFCGALREELGTGQEGRSKGMMLTSALTEIKGGTSHNVTPKECEAVMDIRVPVDATCKGVEERISKSVKRISRERGIEAFYSILDETDPFEAPHDSPLVRSFNLGVMDVEKCRPTLIRKTGTGDMNVVGNRLGIPVVTYGPGDPHQAHTINEMVSISEYLSGIEVLKRMLHHLKRLHERKR